MNSLKKFVTFAAILVLAVSAMGQGQGRRGFGRGFGPTQIVNRDEVKDELKLTDDQKTKISDWQTANGQKRREAMQALGIDFQNMTDDDRKKMADLQVKMNDEAMKDLTAILTGDQLKRLREISIQAEGASAAADPEFQKDLGITDEQKAKIGTLQKKQMDAMRDLFQKVQDGSMDRSAMGEAMTKNNQIMKDEIAKLLSADQLAKIKSMSGAPFALKEGN